MLGLFCIGENIPLNLIKKKKNHNEMDLSSSIGPYITINLHGLFFFFFNPLILLLLKNLPKKVKTNMKMSILVTKKHQLNLFLSKILPIWGDGLSFNKVLVI